MGGWRIALINEIISGRNSSISGHHDRPKTNCLRSSPNKTDYASLHVSNLIGIGTLPIHICTLSYHRRRCRPIRTVRVSSRFVHVVYAPSCALGSWESVLMLQSYSPGRVKFTLWRPLFSTQLITSEVSGMVTTRRRAKQKRREVSFAFSTSENVKDCASYGVRPSWPEALTACPNRSKMRR